jgi:putative FmdB family regulatory protein
MPIYEYTCSSCGQKTEFLHGIHDPVPPFCPECGAEGTLRKGFAPPAIVFKGSGWAKKDRAATRSPGSPSSSSASGGSGGDGESGSGSKGATSEPSSSSSGDAPKKPSTGGGAAVD